MNTIETMFEKHERGENLRRKEVGMLLRFFRAHIARESCCPLETNDYWETQAYTLANTEACDAYNKLMAYPDAPKCLSHCCTATITQIPSEDGMLDQCSECKNLCESIIFSEQISPNEDFHSNEDQIPHDILENILFEECSDNKPTIKDPPTPSGNKYHSVSKMLIAQGISLPQNEVADAARVIAWAKSNPRKPANIAFTAGPERQAAYWIEWTEKQNKNNGSNPS